MPSGGVEVIRITSLVSHDIVRVDGVLFQPSTPRFDGERALFGMPTAQLVHDDIWTNGRRRCLLVMFK